MPEESTANDGAQRPEKEAGLPLDDVGRLVELLAESGVGEIRVRQGELKIIVKAKSETRAGARAEAATEASVGQPSAAGSRAVHQAGAAPEATPAVESVADRNGGLHLVCSPVVGTFYRAPAPSERPYVEIGDRVRVGQPLCIIEAMKLMNEIPADASGEVVEILAENAKGVEYDQPLFRIRPEAS